MDKELLAAEEEVDQVLLLVLNKLNDEGSPVLVHVVYIGTILIDQP